MSLELSPAGRRYGYRKDPLDHRDFGIATMRFSPTVQLPRVDWEPYCGSVFDQGDEGSCTAHYGLGQRRFLAQKYQGLTYDFSPAYIYWLCLQMDAFYAKNNRWATNDELLAFAKTNKVHDEGSFGRTVCRVLNQFGACTRTAEPYVPGDFATPPNQYQLNEGLRFKSGAYHRIANVQDMKSCLASGYVFGIGFTVYESFEKIGSDGLWEPDTRESILGGHEVMVMGYDDIVNGGSFKVRNSWGPSWAASGNFWMRYSDAGNPDILMDAWMTHLGRAW